MTNEKIVARLSQVGIFGNIILCAFKLFAGIFGKSGAMVSDAVHSLSDVLATFVAWFGTRISGKRADAGHPYGHERFECVASLILGAILAITGIGIGWNGLQKIMSGSFAEIEIPGILPLVAAVVSIAAKEAMYRYTMHYAKKLNSAVFKADAWHHRSDALSSIASLIGIAAARLGFPVMDPIASIIICVFILKVSYDVAKDALNRMMDASCSSDYEKRLTEFVLSIDGVEELDVLRTRLFGNKVYVDAEISCDGSLTLVEAHDIAEKVHKGIEHNFEDVKHVMVHVNPKEV